jgi:hypothetical protein
MVSLKNDTQTPERLISRAIDSFDEDLRQILILHNGKGNTRGLPFEALADRLDRPIQDLIAAEKTAIRTLRHPAVSRLMAETLRKADNVIWQALGGEDDIVYKYDLNQQIQACLPGELLIAIKCIYDNVKNWLDHHAYQNRIAWYRTEYPETAIRGATKQLRQLKGSCQFPLPFQRLAEQMKIEKPLLNQALALARNRFEVYRGYVCALPIGSRALRAVRIHLMFFYRHPNRFLSLEKIHAEYLDTYPDDDAVQRDLFLAIMDHLHIFMRLGNLGWCSIMTAAGQDPYLQKNASTKLHQPDQDKGHFFFKRHDLESPLMDHIKASLKQHGMARPVEIEAFLKENYKDRVDESMQIAPLVAGSHDLLQVSPTVYALRKTHGNLDPQSAKADMLLTYSDLRWYIISRYAGEPMNTFPLWTPGMERKWCRWAEKSATNPKKSRFFQSLMYVADPHCWLVGEDEKRYWLESKKWNAGYYFRHDCKHRIWSKIPPLRDLLTLSICICRTVGMNWVRVNRIAGYYLFDQHSVTHLALLIALGVLKPTGHWQHPHGNGHMAEELSNKLMGAFQIDPICNWDSDIGLELRKHLLDLDEDQDLGWVDIEDLALLSKKLAGECVAPDVNDAENSNSGPDLLSKQLDLPF